ncbi:hypothetical protein G5I_03716 [Acromyrmex echinatior]|uniref:Uncharacterized protein n=1 Tax=Acromyrmex echinatior TaxID=103372 RepID=F4WDQ8_ACREC|nr:hypothetical protein G5I_03716 [Acromyrmex echinatior]
MNSGLELLGTKILDPAILPNTLNSVLNNIFQQDGAGPHNARIVTNYLNQQFWIDRYGPIRWRARSPDLNLLDSFLWGYCKEVICWQLPEDIEELNDKLHYAIWVIESKIDGHRDMLYTFMMVNFNVAELRHCPSSYSFATLYLAFNYQTKSDNLMSDVMLLNYAFRGFPPYSDSFLECQRVVNLAVPFYQSEEQPDTELFLLAVFLYYACWSGGEKEENMVGDWEGGELRHCATLLQPKIIFLRLHLRLYAVLRLVASCRRGFTRNAIGLLTLKILAVVFELEKETSKPIALLRRLLNAVVSPGFLHPNPLLTAYSSSFASGSISRSQGNRVPPYVGSSSRSY